MGIASDADFTDAVIAALVDEGLRVGDAVAPSDQTYPYVIVWPMPSGGTSGPMGAVHDDEDFVVQITCVGSTRWEAQWASDKSKARMLSGALVVPGRALMSQPRLDVGTGLSRDDDTAAEPLFYAAHRYRFSTTPA